jgi:hypothetical protein
LFWLPTVALALALASKSPPLVVQVVPGHRRCVQVASFVVAAAPWPSSPLAWEVPSPQAACTRCRKTVWSPVLSRETKSVRVTLLMVEPAGTAAATSKASSPRRKSVLFVPLVRPAKKWSPAPLLRVPSSEKIVLSWLAPTVTTSAAAVTATSGMQIETNEPRARRMRMVQTSTARQSKRRAVPGWHSLRPSDTSGDILPQ